MPWSYLSDGTKRLFYIITECVSVKNGIVLMEEPKLRVHPHQLFSLMNFIKEQAREKQIIVTTHSPIVLDILSPDELNKITIVSLAGNKSVFNKLSSEQMDTAKQYMEEKADLSYYWLHSDLEK
ncbi:MAG: ATP-binding protein [Taibaiella sp.]|nr:ATP-binding protein [Taibaiella sp.]